MKKFLLKLLLCVLLICTSAICFIGCSEDGANGKDGISVEQIYVGEDGHLYVKLTGDTSARDLGLVATPSVEQEGFSKGLVYQVNSDRTGYVITGIGTNTDKVLKIPETYNGLPVTGFSGEFIYDLGEDANDNYIEKIILSKNTNFHLGGGNFFMYLENFSNLHSLEIAEDNAYYKTIDGVVFSKDGKTLFYYPKNKQDKTFVVPNQVTSIGSFAFAWCDSLTSVEIPDSVTSIGESAFYYCTSLTRVDYTGTIDQWAQIEFSSGSSNPLCCAKNLYIDGELVTEAKITTATKISAYAFDNCTSLTSVEIGDSVTSIGMEAFYNCTSLTSIEIPDSVTSIGYVVFYYCTSLTSITFNGTVEEWNALGYYDWNSDVPATKIICSDGEVTI